MEKSLSPPLCENDELEGRFLEKKMVRNKLSLNARRKREFMPDERKDATYWEKRRKNNEAAKRSREKRRHNDIAVESKLLALNEENMFLKAELLSLKLKFGLISSSVYTQQTQALHSSLRGYFLGQEALKVEHQFFDADPSFCMDNCCLNFIPFPPRTMSADSSYPTFNHAPALRNSMSLSDIMDQNQCSLSDRYNFLASQPRRHEPIFKPSLCSTYLDYRLFDKYSHSSSPSFYDGRASSVSPNAAEADAKDAKTTSEEDNEQEVPKVSSFGVYNTRHTSTEKTKDKNCSALPHKLRIKAKSVRGQGGQQDALRP
nr:PREDICTED: nuclear factor interleukin-3-regulated protein [Latimeria chalumnae]|eukprot:XP_005989978.1 PREDICTED: nuclear factor interleukin-3-regulated protein [Latimeria chalumnae]